MKTVFIYALKDPITDEIRYIGKAEDLTKRFQKHLVDKQRNHRTNWIQSLLTKGFNPIMVEIDEIPVEFWQPIEVAYIQFFREEGCDLVNGNDGGEGGHNPTESSRNKMRASQKGRTVSQECRSKLRAANLGKTLSQETRSKMSENRTGSRHWNFGKHHSFETRSKISMTKLNKKQLT